MSSVSEGAQVEGFQPLETVIVEKYVVMNELSTKKAPALRYRIMGMTPAASILLVVAGLIDGAHAASASGTAVATVMTPITVFSDANVSFRAFSTNAGGQSVFTGTGGKRTLIEALGGRSGASALGTTSPTMTSEAASLMTATGDAVLTYTITVGGEAALSYAITMPTSLILTAGSGDAATTITVTDFLSSAPETGALTDGAKTLTMGATLATINSNVAGQYSGSFKVMINYN